MYVCPCCKSNQFNGYTQRVATLTVVDQEDGSSIPQIVTEDQNYVALFATCVSCGHTIDVDGSNLAEANLCTSCGVVELLSNLDENGVCATCNAPPAELVGLTENEYIRKIIALQKQLKDLQGDVPTDIPDEGV